MTGVDELLQSCIDSLQFEAELTVSEWADSYRMLSGKASSEPGRWRTDRTPYLREPMDCLSISNPVQRVVLQFAAQTGKALALDTPIATPEGWTTMGELRPGDRVFDEKGRPTEVLGVSPVMHDHQCYRVVFSDGAEIVADAEHLWTVSEYQHGKCMGSKTITTETIRTTFKDGTRNRYAIPVAGALKAPRVELPIHPYALGVWLGDGNSASNQVTTHSNDAHEIAGHMNGCGHPTLVRRPDWVKGNCLNLLIEPKQRNETHCIRGHELAVTGVYTVTKRGNPTAVCAECKRQQAMHYKYGRPLDQVLPTDQTFYSKLNNLGLINSKHIPTAYLRASVKQRLELLRGLMDTDGHIDKRGKRCELAFSSERLAADAYELVVSLGLKPSLIQRPNHWRISFMAYGEQGVFRLARKRREQPVRQGRRTTEAGARRIVAVDPVPSVPVRCIRVAAKSHLFLAGRAMVPTHNTEAGSNWLGYVIHHAPGPMLMVQPTVDMAKRLSKQRLEGLINETQVLSDLIAPARSRDSGNTMFSKDFPGGIMILTGANSSTGLRSSPCRYIFLDEVDAYPLDVDGEGDPVTLAERRSTTFSRRKILMTSTPTVKELSRIETEYLLSDQRRYFVPCPCCGHYQWLQWGQMKWQDNDPSTVRYECEACHERFEEQHKTRMLAAGEWRPTAPGDGGRTAGFHLSGLYSPLGWKSWEEIVEDFLKSKGDAPRLKTWVNTVLGETWEEDYAAKVGADTLMQRLEVYEPQQVPERALIVTAGVDVQDNRLAVSVWAWGREEEGWLLDHQEIYGDPAGPELWKQLDQLILRPFPHELGAPLKPDVIAIDSGGHFTAEVYQYARERREHGVVAIKGQSQRGKPPIGKATKVDINWKGRALKSGAEVFPVGSDTIKTTLFGRLRHNDPGPGYLHFHHKLEAAYFDQITAEKQVVRFVKGFPQREWVKKPSARNEALDCMVYAYAALHRLYQRYDRRTIWDQLEGRALPATADKPQEAPLRSKKPAQRRSYVNNW